MSSIKPVSDPRNYRRARFYGLLPTGVGTWAAENKRAISRGARQITASMLERIRCFGTRGRIGNLRYSLGNMPRASGIRFRAHDLPRTFAALAESLDIPAYVLKRLMAHKTQEGVTDGYRVICPERRRAPRERIGDSALKAAGAGAGVRAVAFKRRTLICWQFIA